MLSVWIFFILDKIQRLPFRFYFYLFVPNDLRPIVGESNYLSLSCILSLTYTFIWFVVRESRVTKFLSLAIAARDYLSYCTFSICQMWSTPNFFTFKNWYANVSGAFCKVDLHPESGYRVFFRFKTHFIFFISLFSFVDIFF